jgi:hypothetical protein
MKFQTTDRELVCMLIALNSARPEQSHSARKRKDRAYDELQLIRIEEQAAPGGIHEGHGPALFAAEPVEVDMEKGTQDYLLEKFGKDGEVGGGAFVERTVSRFVDRLTKAT